MRKMIKSNWKYILLAFFIMIIVFIGGAILLTFTSGTLDDKQINYTEFTVSDKYVDKDGNNNYVIVSDQNQKYELDNDDFGSDIYKDIEVGKHYKFVTQKDNRSITTHIIQVHNDSN